MNRELLRTLIGLTVIAGFIIILGLFLFNKALSPFYFRFFPYLVLIFWAINAAFFVFFYRSVKKTDQQFIRNFMGAAGIKTIFYFTLVLVYIFTTPQHAISFSITLLILYFTFTAYDLYVMLKLMKRKKEKNTFPNHMSN